MSSNIGSIKVHHVYFAAFLLCIYFELLLKRSHFIHFLVITK